MKMKEERHDKRRGEKIERREERRQQERRKKRREKRSGDSDGFCLRENVRSARESSQQITRGTMQTLQGIAGRRGAWPFLVSGVTCPVHLVSVCAVRKEKEK